MIYQYEELQFKHATQEEERKATQEKKTTMQKLQQELAEEWGLPWPKPTTKDGRKGGPIPRSQKWRDGLYDWIARVGKAELQKPTEPPKKVFPSDWDAKECPVWQYKPKEPEPPLLVDPDPEDLPPPLVDEDPDGQTELEPPKEDPDLEKKTIADRPADHLGPRDFLSTRPLVALPLSYSPDF